jgi:WD40 repeat protein
MAHLPNTFVHALESRNLFSHAGQAVAVAFGPDSRLLALGGGVKATVDLWDSHRAIQVGELSGHRPSWLVKTIGSLAFSPDGRLLATCRSGSNVRIYR